MCLILQPIKERPNIKYMGYVDLIIYNKQSEEYTIFDIKTSTKGWSKWQKGDAFDMSILLTSLLIGVGYDAYCIFGIAPKEITTKNYYTYLTFNYN